MSEYDYEPVRGLPGPLPKDEVILWQGAPDWKYLASGALHFRLAALYAAVLIAWTALQSDVMTALGVASLGAALLALLALFAWGVSRTTVYTLTNRRIVLRIGVALNACINLPLREIEAANLKTLGGGHGSIALQLKGVPRLGYWTLWPHARSFRIVRPQPMIRAIPQAQQFAQLLFNATEQLQSITPHLPADELRQDRPLQGASA